METMRHPPRHARTCVKSLVEAISPNHPQLAQDAVTRQQAERQNVKIDQNYVEYVEVRLFQDDT